VTKCDAPEALRAAAGIAGSARRGWLAVGVALLGRWGVESQHAAVLALLLDPQALPVAVLGAGLWAARRIRASPRAAAQRCRGATALTSAAGAVDHRSGLQRRTHRATPHPGTVHMPPADPGTGGLPPVSTPPAGSPAPGYPPLPPTAGPAPGVVYAILWQRLAAYLVDLLIMGGIGALVRILLLGRHSGAGDLYAAILTALVVHAAYLIGLWQTGQTLGMRLLDLVVLRAEDGARLTPLQAFMRFIPFGLALILPFLGVLVWLTMAITVAVDPRGQGLQDRLAGSVVVRRAR
jgi:uncharacterized RDD family membrane protein YckC